MQWLQGQSGAHWRHAFLRIGKRARRLPPCQQRHLYVETLNMPGIPREVVEHAMKIYLGSKPMKQRLRRFDEEKRRAIGEEIAKLSAAGFIKEVYHPEWLANPVLV